MATNNQELQKWVDKFQRKLDSIPLTKWDREDLEELMTIIVSVALKQIVQPTAQPTKTPAQKNGGER